MATLPITRIILYKHGVGYFERRGAHSGEELRLSFAREAMDDVLKSLVALDLGSGQVLSVDFETPEDRAALIARGSIHLSDSLSMLDLLRDLRGRAVRCVLAEGKKDGVNIEGLVVGVDYEPEEPLRRATVAIYQAETRQVRAVRVEDVARVELLDDSVAADLSYFLRAARSEEDRRAATVHLSPGDHDLLIGYIAPAPAWRVSYRLLFEEKDEDSSAPTGSDSSFSPHPSSFVLLQGWGLFDNQLDEDLEGVELALVAGMPVSFRYRLYEPHTPERPLVQDEERTVSGPIGFAAAPPAVDAFGGEITLGAPMMEMEMAMAAAESPPAPQAFKAARRISAQEMEEAVQTTASGDERGALFAYQVSHPVSVGRGQSAMVPIVSRRMPARRDLLYNAAKLPAHPVASLRLSNETGLTLERGPVTVLEQGDYAGEAVLPFTRTGSELIVAYAVELGVTVEEQRRSERRAHAVAIKGDYARFEEYDLAIRVYHINSSLDKPVEVTIEHARMHSYDLADTRAPDEEAAGFARWRVPCPPQTRTVFSVTERRLMARNEQIRGLTGAYLAELLKAGLINQAVAKALEEILALYRQADEAGRQIQRLERERETVYKQQRQIQGNIQPLGREGDEGVLRQRYVATLSQLEDQLATLAAREKELRAEIARLEEEAASKLKNLAGRK